MKTITFKLLLLGLTVICLTTHAQTTKYVTMNGAGFKDGSSWEHAYDSTGIQTAIDAMTTSSGYNMVWVAKGTYYPTTANGFRVLNGVKLIGGFAGYETDTIQRVNYKRFQENETILSGDINRDGYADANSTVIYYHNTYTNYESGNNQVDGFTITMAGEHGVLMNTTGTYPLNPTITNNIITNNDYGIKVELDHYDANSAPVISYNEISDNTSSGIFCFVISEHGYCYPTIEYNLITGNSGSNGGGIFVGTNFTYSECNPSISHNIISNNSASDSGGGIFCFSSYHSECTATILDNTITNNTSSNYGGGICIEGSTSYGCVSTPTIENNEILNNSSSYGGGIAFRPLGPSFNFSPTIENNSISYNYASNDGAGLYLYNVSGLTIQNNNITNNICDNNGGGLYFGKFYSSIYASYNTFGNNISHNIASRGGGLYITSTSVDVYKNQIFNNEATSNGAGMYLIAEDADNSTNIFNNIIFNNSSNNYGGAFYCKSIDTDITCNPSIINNVIANNLASLSADCIYSYSQNTGSLCSPEITNNILWGGSNVLFFDNSGSGSVIPNITYCAIQDGFTGEGNIDISTINPDGPMFLLPTSFIGNAQTSADTLELENANWNVSVCSPVVNAGLNSAVPSDLTTDFNGDTRIFGGTVDLGAYEQQSSIDVPVTITGLTSACDGETLTLDASEGFSGYEWTGGTTNQTMEVTETNTYSVTVSDINGCTGTDEITVTFHEIPSSTILGETEACEGETITLSVTETDLYNWSTGSTDQTTGVTETGRYYITVTSEYDCQSNDSIDIIIYSLPVISIDGNDFACQGHSEIITATTGFENYAWSGGEDTESITVNVTGTYSVTVTDINNCENSYEFEFTVYDPTPEFINSTDACIGDIIELSLSEDFESYDWSDFTSESTLLVTENGTYSVTVNDDHACTASTSIDMTFHELPVPEITGDESTCYGQSVTFDAGDYSFYLWSNDESSQTISASVTGNYSVSVTDEFGCTGTDNIDLTVFSLPIPVISGDTEACDGEFIDLLVDEFANYEWSTSSNSQTITVSTSGEYTVTVTDLNNCQGTDSYNVTFHTLPVPEISGDDEACDGETITLDAGVFTSYEWNDATTERLNDVTLSGNYSVIVTDVHGCTGNDDIDITFHPIPATPTITRNEFVLTSSSATGNQWYLDGTGITGANSQNYTCTADGDYSIVVTSEYGCVSSESQEVNVFGTNIASFEAYGISLYPNPANEQIWINTDGTYIGFVIQIQNNLGQIIIEQQISSENTKIMLFDIPAGHYLVTIITEELVLNSKFIKL